MPGWLIFVHSTPHRKIPAEIHTTLSRKLDIINAATSHRDLRFLREPIRRVVREITGIFLH